MSCLFVDELNWGTKLGILKDSYQYVNFFEGFNFCFYGVAYEGVYINSNGNITFNQGDGTSEASFEAFINSLNPRIGAFWGNLDTEGSFGGRGIYYKSLENAAIITWVNIPFAQQGETPNTFQIVLCKNGVIGMAYDTIDNRLLGRNPFVGIAAGSGKSSRVFRYDGELNQSPGQTVEGPIGTLANSQIFFRLTHDDYELVDRIVNFDSEIIVPCGFELDEESPMFSLLNYGCGASMRLETITLPVYMKCIGPTQMYCKWAFGCIKLNLAVLIFKNDLEERFYATAEIPIPVNKLLCIGELDGIESNEAEEIINLTTLEALTVGEHVATILNKGNVYAVKGTIRLHACCKLEIQNPV
ncbi:MAG: hypothetical protein AB9856_07580 [Cellulosilyticaceae bacterium]